MIDLLKIVNKATTTKSTAVMSHFRIVDGAVTATNGAITINAEVAELDGINATVPAAQFLTAIAACKDEPQITTTDKSMMVKAGSFKARLPRSFEPFPDPDWNGEEDTVPPDFSKKLGTAAKFIGGRYTGVLIKNGYAYATDNASMVRVELDGFIDSDFTLPEEAVKLLTTINEQPVAASVAENYAVIEYASFKIRCSTLALEWPDVDKYIQFTAESLDPIPDGLSDAVKTVTQFLSKSDAPRVTFRDGAVYAGGAEIGGFDLPDVVMGADAANVLLSIMDKADFSVSPMRFAGHEIVGVCAGVKA